MARSFIPLDLTVLDGLVSSHKRILFFDTARPTAKDFCSYLFINPVKILMAWDYAEVEHVLKEIDSSSRDFWVCGYISYEAAYAVEARFKRFQKQHGNPMLPLLWFGVFDEPLTFDHRNGSWSKPLPRVKGNKIASSKTAPVKSKIDYCIERKEFCRKIDTIRQYIGKGDTYQVNFTFDLHVRSASSPFALYKCIRENQRTPYCSFIQNEFGHVASFSPELFFSKRKRIITVKPMKGTASRGYSAQEDVRLKEFLKSDPKNRAENLMIVDLLRNDLGRIAMPGSVIVEKMFTIETHPTLHQMTSTVRAALRPGVSFSTIIRNIFPCGSVTGAPKVRTMEIIHELEKGNRGVYCGAVGYVSPESRALFSVPIRTLQRGNKTKAWNYRVGSGIIWDSRPADEWEECLQKCSFLSAARPDFEIIESLLFTKNKKLLYAADHLKRMRASAAYFGYPFSSAEFLRTAARIQHALSRGSDEFKVRILLDKKGNLRWDSTVVDPAAIDSTILAVSNNPIDGTNKYLFHKTTHMPWYEEARKGIVQGKWYDVVFCNNKGEVTEGARSTIFIKKHGILFTPPVSSGLLPGVLRNRLIAGNKCQEKILYFQDLLSADEIFCGNSVRGLKKVMLDKKYAQYGHPSIFKI